MTSPAGTTEPLPEQPVRARVGALRLTVLAGPDRGVSATFHQERVLLGRGETADLRLTDKTVSACHCELRSLPQGIQISDLDSRNGVRLGGVSLKRGIVRSDNVLHLGSSAILLEAAGERMPDRTTRSSFCGLVGGSLVMRELYAALERLAPTELSVIIQGETGTGKELAARALHAASRRADGPFVVLDCTTLSASLAASQLFGHERGAFTGATERRQGAFEAAHRGVLFIDEVGELPAELQPMFLRVLAERTIVPVGSSRPRPVDVRIVSASWRDLRSLVNQGKFREDLYFRLAQATVWMPSLSERTEDMPALVQHCLHELRSRLEGSGEPRAAVALEEEALAALLRMRFPGNVRELRSVVERLALLCGNDVITVSDLSFERVLAATRDRKILPPPAPDQAPPPGTAATELIPYKDAKRSAMDEFEHQYLERLLQRAGHNLSRAAALAGLARQNLRELLRKHGLYERGE